MPIRHTHSSQAVQTERSQPAVKTTHTEYKHTYTDMYTHTH